MKGTVSSRGMEFTDYLRREMCIRDRSCFMQSIIFWLPMAARHNILPTFCRFCLWQSEKQFLEQKGCDRWPFYPPQCSISQSGDFCTLPYGHKREKNREKVQNEREARGKYRTEQVKMDIKQRKARKKVQNERDVYKRQAMSCPILL